MVLSNDSLSAICNPNSFGVNYPIELYLPRQSEEATIAPLPGEKIPALALFAAAWRQVPLPQVPAGLPRGGARPSSVAEELRNLLGQLRGFEGLGQKGDVVLRDLQLQLFVGDVSGHVEHLHLRV